jgi:hypothetical protein
MSDVQDRPTIQAVAADLVAMCRRGQFNEAGDKYWADDVLSVEPVPGEMAQIRGKAEVRAKGEWWIANTEVHASEVDGPWVHGDQFLVRFRMDRTPKGGERGVVEEVGLYTVRDGKIAEERFFYAV